MIGYTEHRSYSPTLDCEVVRLSTVDDRNSEFYAIVPAEPAREYRKRREAALIVIEAAIACGLEPGEVAVR